VSTPADRQRAYRARQRSGHVVLKIKVNEHEVAEALLLTDKLSPEKALDRAQVGQALSKMITEWSRAWIKKRCA
jgi:hypothetical protein